MKAENLQTDEELAFEARNGSEVAFNELVDRYAQTVYRVGYGITGNRQETEDIVQETFFKAFRHVESFSPDKASFKTWLLTIARNQSINVFSSLKRKAMTFFSADENEAQSYSHTHNPFQSQHDPETQLSIKQEHKKVEDAVTKIVRTTENSNNTESTGKPQLRRNCCYNEDFCFFGRVVDL